MAIDSDFVYALRPLLYPLLLPPFPGLLLTLLGGWLAWRRRRVGWLLIVVGAATIWLACTERAAEFVLVHLLHPPAPLALDEVDRLAASAGSGGTTGVLVLGGGIVERAPEYGTSDLNPISIERLRYGIWLARRLDAPLAFSGGLARGRDPVWPAEADVARRVAAEQFGFSIRWVEARARDTGENLRFGLQLLERDGIRRVMLVTHRTHLPRALRAAALAGAGDRIEVVAAGVDYRDADQPFTWDDWMPSAAGFAKTRSALIEWLGWIARR